MWCEMFLNVFRNFFRSSSAFYAQWPTVHNICHYCAIIRNWPDNGKCILSLIITLQGAVLTRVRNMLSGVRFLTFSEEDNMIAVWDTCSTGVLREDLTSFNATNLSRNVILLLSATEAGRCLLMVSCVCRFVTVWWPLPGEKLRSNEDRLPNPPVTVEELDSPQKTEGSMKTYKHQTKASNISLVASQPELQIGRMCFRAFVLD